MASRAISAAVGPEHPLAKLFSIDLAIAMDAAGATRDALRLVVEAEPVLRQSTGADSATFLRLQLLKQTLERKLQSGRSSQVGAQHIRPNESSPAVVSRDFFT